MNNADRDPRIDPRPGDVLESVFSGATYLVTGIEDGHVIYRKTTCGRIPLDGWREIRTSSTSRAGQKVVKDHEQIR